MMVNNARFNISDIINELDNAVLSGDTVKADELTAMLFHLQGGTEEQAAMPAGFTERIAHESGARKGEKQKMSRPVKRLIYIAAAAALITALSLTALATDFFGIRSLVFHSGTVFQAPPPEDSDTPAMTTPEPQTLIVLQGYPDSPEYKASQEWNTFLAGYDTDYAILNKVGNGPTEFSNRYPMYNIYSQEMADQLDAITAKYNLKLHQSIYIVTTPDELYSTAGIGRFISSGSGGTNMIYSGYVYDDGTFHYDGQAILSDGTAIDYQLGNYTKGAFSDTYLNIGDANSYREWSYKTSGGTTVSLALGNGKALVITDLGTSFLTINVLAGTSPSSQFDSGVITAEQLQSFADLFDFEQINT